ncbi:uncharacterized protein PFL1_01829 [Pseudozyma flocculosa PF-1]|uniref:uncharacterized protein n=1 Tax=Pseudozyma flocculosa PF-1 TaxID=1277687 RepID=UPI0004561A3A|nr:uncharacterized protein PFL1_01829 [Pseudozyma flocculosa PF-1]EPQ30931.1 hypothetical protein PFL1_01829 [Pseudozyma flocculosa PF-1]
MASPPSPAETAPTPSTTKMAGLDADDDDNKALMRRVDLMHLDDMPSVARQGTGIQGWLQRLFSDLAYFVTWLRITWFGVATSLPNYILDPLGAASVLLFAGGSTVILSAMLVISAVWRLGAVQAVFRRVSERNGGVGLGNLAYPQIFDSLDRRTRDAAFQVMNRPLEEFSQPSTSSARTFDLELAKMLFCCASLVYERDGSAMEDACKIACRAAPVRPRAGHAHAPAPGESLKASSGLPNAAGQAVLDKLTARSKWGLHYRSISELGTNTSPVCGAFWDPNSNFIILSFKGTNPVEFKEWALDFTIRYTEGGAWLPGFGKVHSGFYESLFPSDIRQGATTGYVGQLLHDAYLTVFGPDALDEERKPPREFPYEQIRHRIEEIAKLLVKNSADDHVNLFVTGHSLGAALASFFFARAVASPKDFGSNSEGDDLVRVRDAYTFGCPIFGDPECIEGFGRAIHDNLDRPQTLWRVTNRHDPVATMLPEGGDYEMLSHISPTSQFHYAHIGAEIQMRHRNNLVGAGPGTLLPKGARVKVITHLGGSGSGPDVRLPLWCRILEQTPVVSRLVSHIPSCYWARLSTVEAVESLPWLGREPALVSL